MGRINPRESGSVPIRARCMTGKASPPRRPLPVRLLYLAILLSGLGAIAAGIAVCVFLSLAGRTPREWAPYLQRRAEKHRAVIVQATDMVAQWLIYADRMAVPSPPLLPAFIGASPERSGQVPPGRVHVVDSSEALAGAVAAAQPGDIILIAPGRYRLSGYHPISASRPGTATAPITVRAERLGDVTIESDMVETFKVFAPFWRFENLVMSGVCADHSTCEHAIHVVGGAKGTVIRNNRFQDYNAHLKINGEGAFPDDGVIEGNTFIETVPRNTANPITPIDLVTASGWRISGNFIADFQRADPAGATYGAFVKGAGEANILERNLVICEWTLHAPGQHVGLSLGGGGTGTSFRRDQGRTGFEQVGGVIRDNLIAGCSDDGIYLNRSARSVVDHNTLLDTAGIDARFIETSATVTANLVDGAVRGRDGATLAEWDNDKPLVLSLFAGWHPQRGTFRNPGALDLAWRKQPAHAPVAESRPDLCGRPRGQDAPVGAFSDYTACLSAR